MSWELSDVMVEAAADQIFVFVEMNRKQAIILAGGALRAAFAAAVQAGEARFVDNGLFRGMVMDEKPILRKPQEREK